MSDNKDSSNSVPAVHYITGQYPAVQQNDEIDLKKLVLGLWSERWLIISIASFVTVIALAYALMATPYYKTNATLWPAPAAYFIEFNNAKVSSIDSSKAFQMTLTSLQSLAKQQEFFLARRDLFEHYFKEGSSEEAFSGFLKNGFVISLPDEKKDKGKGNFIRVSYVAPKGVSGSDVVNQYIDYVLGVVKSKIVAEYGLEKSMILRNLNEQLVTKNAQLETSVQIELARLEELDSIRFNELNDQKAAIELELKLKRSNRIELLKESLAIAEKLDIENPQTMSSFAARSAQTGAILAEVNSGHQPLFLMGTKALSAEAETLSQRKVESIADSRIAEIDRQLKELESNRRAEEILKRIGDERFIADIDSLKTEIFRLKSLPLEFEDLKSAEIVDSAYTDPNKIKPKRAIIFVLGAVLGGVLGIFIALLRQAFL